MKKILIGLAVMIALSGLVGCGTQTKPQPQAQEQQQAKTAAPTLKDTLNEFEKTMTSEQTKIVDHMETDIKGKNVDVKIYMKEPENASEQMSVGFGGLILLGSVERTVKAYSPDYKTQYELYVGKTLKGRKLLDKNVIETLDSTGKWVEMKNETAQ